MIFYKTRHAQEQNWQAQLKLQHSLNNYAKWGPARHLAFIVKGKATKYHGKISPTQGIIIHNNNCGFIDCDVVRDRVRLRGQGDTQSSVLIEFIIIKEVQSNHEHGCSSQENVLELMI